jgi:hypothetical protein
VTAVTDDAPWIAVDCPITRHAKIAMTVDGQPTGPRGYDIIDSPIMVYWMPVLRVAGRVVQHPHAGGYKLHVSVDPADADRVARGVLPLLQSVRVSHKVVYPLSAYGTMNAGEQRGKFITVYAGPTQAGFAMVADALDACLREMKARPGPQALDRLAGYACAERSYGQSGLLSFVIVASYRC